MQLKQTMAVLLAVATAVAGCAGTGRGAPDFQVEDTEGTPWTLADFAGRPVVLFFASVLGCAPCEIETKNTLNPVHEAANGTVGFLTVSVVPYETNRHLEEFMNRTGASWPHARDTDTMAQKYDVYQLSTVVVLNADHEIVFKDVDPARSTLEAKLGL